MTYSIDLRQRVVGAMDDGDSIAAVARRFLVSRATVRNWCDRHRRGRLTADKPGVNKPRKITAMDDTLMRQQIAAQPGITAKQLMAMLSVTVVESTVCRRLNKLGLPLKKRR